MCCHICEQRAVESAVAAASVQDDVLSELQRLREENEQLRLRLDAQHIGNPQ